MLERLEWELVPRVRSDRREQVEAIALAILELDELLADGGGTAQSLEELPRLHKELAECLVSPCEASGAPLLDERQGWNQEVEKAFGLLPPGNGMSFDDFQVAMSRQHDCSRCPGGSGYPGLGGIPCTFDLTPLKMIVGAAGWAERVGEELSPPAMAELAGMVERCLWSGQYRSCELADSRHYLAQMAAFLRFWSARQFGVAAASGEE